MQTLRIGLFVGSLIIVGLVTGSCGSDDDSSASATTAAEAACLQPSQGDAAPEYVGLTESEAEELAGENGLAFRVVGADGDCFAITMDLREDRVNVEVVDGVVIAAAMF